ncbi:MAG: hypothetical protein IJ439_03675 [Tyzzerella sp.]|nr:hypothetical protein [Tyzzerella sp.]
MSEIKIPVSMENTEELKKMILENPELPLLIFAGEESYCGEYDYNSVDVKGIKIKELTMDGDRYVERDTMRDKLMNKYYDNFCIGGAYMKKDLEEFVEKQISRMQFTKAIVIYVG